MLPPNVAFLHWYYTQYLLLSSVHTPWPFSTFVKNLDSRIPKQLLFSELHSGKRSRGAPKKRFKDTLKASLKCFDVDPENWELQAQQRDSWRSTITNSALSYEAKRILQAESKRQERKSRIANANKTTTANSSSGVTCFVCHRSFRTKIGLNSHMRTHNSTTS